MLTKSPLFAVISILNTEEIIGKPISLIVGTVDYVFNIEITANRGDL